MAALSPLPATSPITTSSPPSLVWLHVEEVAAHLVGRVVDRVHLVARRLQLLLRNHQLLHAARRGQLAAGALLVVLDAQEADKDDEHNRQQAR